jgi:ferredoxin
VKIEIDANVCQGHLRCVALAPALFDADDQGHGIVRGDGSVPADEEDDAADAISGCPERAIRQLTE